ncbi:probable WRKY transcription factor 20 isoform X1 [Punica granatum]|uniref:Probable WRKY transcription factor 20 isoform X1 n=1 Tax=Punica granatum TaxID=22663 RepID=A0A6P8BZ64_PUNGR|nr:probable WRKY transcription factor 20 isoform X1 [Punica granatum]
METSPLGSGAGGGAPELRIRSSEPADDGILSESASDDGAGPSAGGARYRLMSPAKLPITRSAGITIPPGLSPTSFLESPVLLSNVKVEPSPTTGSFIKRQILHGSVVSPSSMKTLNCTSANGLDDRWPGYFEFKPPSRTSLVTAEFNHQSEHVHAQAQYQARSFASARDRAVSSDELTLSTPSNLVTSGANPPAEIDSEKSNQKEHLQSEALSTQSDQKGSGSFPGAENLSDDGYNWRKYGQKLVKGSEFPRSYYKCTHPNCEVKKLFERSPDGRITEIVYKGTHDHPKPQPGRRFTAGTMMPIQEERSERVSSFPGDKSSGTLGQTNGNIEPSGTPELSPLAANDDITEGAACLSNRMNDEADEDDLYSKRRRMDMGGLDITPVVKPIREPRVVVQTLSEVDILDDGYRWRKYGQKVVRGNPNPRSYYKCTNAGCPVRKHVERASHDPKAVITTYEGKHNHDVPIAKTSSHDTAGPSAASEMPRVMPEGSREAISLDLGVGISSSTAAAAENRSVEQQHSLRQQFGQSQPHLSSSSDVRVVQGNAIASHYGAQNGGINLFGSRQNFNGGHSIDVSTLNHSYSYPQNIGRILTGP